MMQIGKKISWVAVSVLAIALAGCCDSDSPLGIRQGGGGGPSSVLFGTAGSYGVLAGSTITNTGNTTVDGSIGTSPGTAITGFPPGTQTGVRDTLAATPQSDLTIAYNDVLARTAGLIPLSGDLTGLTLAPGLYSSTSTLGLTGAVTLDALGDQNAVFIIRTGTTLITGDNSQVILTRGAQAANIIWLVGSSATLGTNSIFNGTIMADQSITANTGAVVNGRLLARTGAVTLDTNAIDITP